MTIDNVPITTKENGQKVVRYLNNVPRGIRSALQDNREPLREQILLRRDSAGKSTRFP